MIKWIKPNDLEIETGDNQATIKMCESLGWKRIEAVERKKPGPKPKHNKAH